VIGSRTLDKITRKPEREKGNLLLDVENLKVNNDKGACVLLISEDLDKIFEMSDRIAVLCNGKLVGIRNTSETDYEEIGRMMSGEPA
jgi:general nucleoside transport system ATP-binding protein